MVSKIIIQVGSGLVQDVFLEGRGKPSNCIVVDFDVMGDDEDEITSVPRKKGREGRIAAKVFEIKLKKLKRSSDVDRVVRARSTT